MSSSVLKSAARMSRVAASLLLLASGAAMAQSTVTLTAGPSTTTLPDGQTVPMWGYTCGAVSGAGVSCTALNGLPQSGGTWQPPLITVPAGQPLAINLVNNLTFTTLGAPNGIPTSLVIDGQLGGGLGTAPSRVPSPTARGARNDLAGNTGAAQVPTTWSSRHPLRQTACGRSARRSRREHRAAFAGVWSARARARKHRCVRAPTSFTPARSLRSSTRWGCTGCSSSRMSTLQLRRTRPPLRLTARRSTRMSRCC